MLLLAVAVVLFREKVAVSPLPEATLDVHIGSGRWKIVGIASGLSFFRQDIPIVGAIADTSWKQSSLKCLLHKKLCLDGPFQRSRVLSTCRIHCSLRWSSLGNLKKLTVSQQVLLRPAATQFLTILPAISLFLRDGRKRAVFIVIPYCAHSCAIQLAPLGRHEPRPNRKKLNYVNYPPFSRPFSGPYTRLKNP